MKELSEDASAVLKRGLALDGPNAERRARVKQGVLAAVGGGALTLGGSAAAAASAGAGGGVAVGATVVGAKGLALGSLLIWFGVGAAAGVGVGGVVAVVEHRAPVSAVQAGAPVHEAATPAPGGPAAGAFERVAPAPPVQGESAAAAAPGAEPRSSRPGRAEREEPAETVLLPTPTGSAASTLREEAALLQRAQRALAAKDPEQALLALAEHERRFATGALSEERKAAKILALCALGRVGEARTLARAFVSAAPRSVLIPRLGHSCAVP